MLVVYQLLQGPRHLINICLFVSGECLPAYDTFIPEHTHHSHTVTQSHSSGASVFVSGQHTLYQSWHRGWDEGHGGDKILSSGLNVEAKNDKRHSINMSQRRHSAIAGG